jgi:hypothetical protein
MVWRPSKPGSGELASTPSTTTGETSSPAGENSPPDIAPPDDKKPKLAIHGNSSGAEPNDPLAHLAPPTLAPPVRTKMAPPLLGHLVGNRDFVIKLECFDDSVVLYPSGQTFEMKAGVSQTEIEDRLVRSVMSLVSRRQASVRAGEPPYRPILRFQVHPDGLRTYFRVYPLLESLRFPMIRENLEG